jgi:hypothetical protein
LLRLALSSDDSTQEHAVEAIEELLVIPSIQVKLNIDWYLMPLSVNFK